jgi:hypothetical protein
MPVNPGYFQASGPVPAGPPQPSAMDDAFKVLASYVGGMEKGMKTKASNDKEMIKMAVESGALSMDLSGGLDAPAYTPVPYHQRPDYLDAASDRALTQAQTANEWGEAGSWSGSGNKPEKESQKDKFLSNIESLSGTERRRLQAQLQDPDTYKQRKEWVSKTFYVRESEADQWLAEIMRNGI